MKYFDAHCHIQFEAYDEDREAIMQSMRDAAVGGLIVGTEKATSEAAVPLADGKDFFAAVGVHPNHEHDEWYDEVNYLPLAEQSTVVAIGECGLDYYRPEVLNEETKRKQKALFLDHIKLAAKVGKPLMVHARPSKGSMDAYEDALDMIEAHGGVTANFHFFVGEVATATRIVSLGCTMSYTAVLTFTHDYDEVVRSLPLGSILTETDSPYVAPAPNRGKRNDPLAVRSVVAAIAAIRGEKEEVVREAVLANAQRVFGIMP